MYTHTYNHISLSIYSYLPKQLPDTRIWALIEQSISIYLSIPAYLCIYIHTHTHIIIAISIYLYIYIYIYMYIMYIYIYIYT